MTYELATKPDPKADYRAIAEMAKKGVSEGQQVSVKLWDLTVTEGGMRTIPTQVEAAKLVSKLRAGLASIKDGRYTVDLIGNIAWVSVNTKPAVSRKKKTVAPVTPPAPKADKKAAGK